MRKSGILPSALFLAVLAATSCSTLVKVEVTGKFVQCGDPEDLVVRFLGRRTSDMEVKHLEADSFFIGFELLNAAMPDKILVLSKERVVSMMTVETLVSKRKVHYLLRDKQGEVMGDTVVLSHPVTRIPGLAIQCE